MSPERDFYEKEATHKTNITPTEDSGRFHKIIYLDD
jgi:hypothetical protein